MVTVDNIYSLGQARGQAYAAIGETISGTVILDFGFPVYYGDVYGTELFDQSTILNLDQIKAAVENYSTGFWYGLDGDYESFLTIIVGLNNIGSGVSVGHGEAWGNMINELNQWISEPPHKYDSQIAIRGGIDIEPSFGPAQAAIDWADGYSTTGIHEFYDFGSLGNCPEYLPPTEPQYHYGIDPEICADTPYFWTQQELFHISWESLKAFPFPEIYHTNGKDARQWYRLSLYAYFHYRTMTFYGTLTTFEACKRNFTDECNYIYNTPAMGHDQLYTELHNDPYDRVREPLYWMTDIYWYYGTP